MDFVRLLKKTPPFSCDAEATGDSLCGSNAVHFEVKNGRLSFYKVEDVETLERVALSVGSARKQPDDVEFCVADEAELLKCGVGIDPVLGTTPFDDVNARHVDLTEVTMRRLSDTAVACARGSTGVVKAEQVIEFLYNALLANPELKLQPTMKESLVNTKVYKRLVRAARAR